MLLDKARLSLKLCLKKETPIFDKISITSLLQALISLSILTRERLTCFHLNWFGLENNLYSIK